MKKIDIKNKFSDEKALKHKDFNKVLSKYNRLKTPFYRSPKFLSMVAVSTIVIMLIFMIDEKEAYSNGSYAAIYHSPIGIPIEHELIELTIEKDKPTQVTTSRGTVIQIPENTLVDSAGNLITGKIDLKYRDFLDQKEVFLSGIPMNYDSNGVSMNFESGGMFELLAYQNENPLYIANDKKVKVDLASLQVEDDYNIYYFSAEEKKWMYKRKDEAGYNEQQIESVNESLKKHPINMSIEEFENEQSNIKSQLKQVKKSKPIQPKLANIKNYSFIINVDNHDYPELINFKGLRFEVKTAEKDFKPEYANETWEDVSIQRGKKSGEFKTCFSNQQIGTVCFLTTPVFNQKDIANAEKMYDKLLMDYKEKKDSIKQRTQNNRKEIAKRTKELNKLRRVELNKRTVSLVTAVENRITRTFQIAQFGIWNSDVPEKMPAGVTVKPIFVDENGAALKLKTVYLVMKNRNMVISLPPGTLEQGLSFNPDEECMLWAVTADLKNVAIVNSDKFKNIRKEDTIFTFEVSLIKSKEFASYSIETIFNLL